jgi:hypothetical protein
MFNKPMIMKTITSVLKALQEYEHAGGFAPAVAADGVDAVLVAPAALVEPTADASVPPPVNEGQEVSPPQSVEAAEAPAFVAEVGTAESVVGEKSSPPRPAVADTEGVETRVPIEPATVVQESTAPKTMIRAASPNIREAEEMGHPCHRVQWAARPGPLSSRALRGRLPPGSTSTPRTTRRPRRAIP